MPTERRGVAGLQRDLCVVINLYKFLLILAFDGDFLEFGLCSCHKLVWDWNRMTHQVVDDDGDNKDFENRTPAISGRGCRKIYNMPNRITEK